VVTLAVNDTAVGAAPIGPVVMPTTSAGAVIVTVVVAVPVVPLAVLAVTRTVFVPIVL
jgi:hypothetical protein